MKKLIGLLMLALHLTTPAGGQPGQVMLHSCRPDNAALPAGTLTLPLPAALSGPLAAAAQQEVRLIYLVPRDRTINPVYASAMANAAHDLQRFYQLQLGNTKTFRLHAPVVETYQTTHDAAWYQNNPNGANFSQFFFNVAQEAFALAGGGFNDPNYVYAIYIDDESACGQCGGCGTSGVLVVGSNDLRGLIGQPSIRYCPTDAAPVQYPPCRWVGGLGHELGHAFGLPHPPGCDNGQNVPCDSNDLMWLGYTTYPATYLRASEQATLNQSAFFTPQGPAPAPASCNSLLATTPAAAAPWLAVSPNPAHAFATVSWPATAGLVVLLLADALGREVRRYPVAARATEATLDVHGLPPGLYVLRSGRTSQKLLVE